jgi:hypothetical protein
MSENDFPKRIYTIQEWQKARKSIEKGYKHCLKISGSPVFKQKVSKAIDLVKTAGYYDFLRTYIGKVVEINGLSQLRECEAAVWLNSYGIEDPVDAASFIIQKAWQMKEYLDGKLYYSGEAEFRAIEKRTEFLNKLKQQVKDEAIKKRCEELIKQWNESIYL